MLQMQTIKSTESTNICYISDRVACTIKVNIKNNGKQWFLANVYVEWTAVRE